MHLHVKVMIGPAGDGYCDSCTAPHKLHGPLFKITVFAGTGNSESEPMCLGCIVKEGSGQLLVEQANLSSGRQAPSAKIKKRSRQQERKIAEDIGGRTQPGSGSQAHAKGDVRKKGQFRIEAKLTKNKTYSLSREVLDKISGECMGGEKPALQLEFLHPVTLKTQDAWVVIPYEDWKELINVAGKDS